MIRQERLWIRWLGGESASLHRHFCHPSHSTQPTFSTLHTAHFTLHTHSSPPTYLFPAPYFSLLNPYPSLHTPHSSHTSTLTFLTPHTPHPSHSSLLTHLTPHIPHSSHTSTLTLLTTHTPHRPHTSPLHSSPLTHLTAHTPHPSHCSYTSLSSAPVTPSHLTNRMALETHSEVGGMVGGAAIEALSSRGDPMKYPLPLVLARRCGCT